MYVNGILERATGGAMHPGGLDVTTRLLQLATPSIGHKVLDIGCGKGRTVSILQSLGCTAYGIDTITGHFCNKASESSNSYIATAANQQLPFANDSFDLIISECSLSAGGDQAKVLSEAFNILRPGGRLAISDIYARNPEGIETVKKLPISCGLQNLMEERQFKLELVRAGFEVLTWEDQSQHLKSLPGNLWSVFGSPVAFWTAAEPQVDPFTLQIAISKANVGYFLLVAEKTNKPQS